MNAGCAGKTEILWERVPYLSALEVCLRRGAIQIHVYLDLYLYSPTAITDRHLQRISVSSSFIGCEQVTYLASWGRPMIVSRLAVVASWRVRDECEVRREPACIRSRSRRWTGVIVHVMLSFCQLTQTDVPAPNAVLYHVVVQKHHVRVHTFLSIFVYRHHITRVCYFFDMPKTAQTGFKYTAEQRLEMWEHLVSVVLYRVNIKKKLTASFVDILALRVHFCIKFSQNC